MVAEYKVRLEAFEGPLDLLLFLIRRAEVDIHDIPIASITEQYLSHLEQLTAGSESGRIDIERAGEFLVMAATLMEIKSRMLAPPSADGDERGDGGSSKGSEDGKAAVDRAPNWSGNCSNTNATAMPPSGSRSTARSGPGAFRRAAGD